MSTTEETLARSLTANPDADYAFAQPVAGPWELEFGPAESKPCCVPRGHDSHE
jgi:hypothetical protein